MFPDNISQNIDILAVINVLKDNFGFHSNQKTQGQKHRVNNLNFKYQVCQMKLRHLNTFLQFSCYSTNPTVAEQMIANSINQTCINMKGNLKIKPNISNSLLILFTVTLARDKTNDGGHQLWQQRCH